MLKDSPHSRDGSLSARWLERAVIGLIAVGVIPSAMSSDGHGNCADTYKNYLAELKRKDMPPERRAALLRWARRVYDACDTGDLDDPKALYERLDRNKS
jgi:hypothetical protein